MPFYWWLQQSNFITCQIMLHVSSQFLLAPDPSKSIREPQKKTTFCVEQQDPDSGAKLPTIHIPIHSGFRVSP